MEHRTILGGEQFLPFARSCVAKLKKLGLAYASQSYEVDGCSIKVRIEPGHEYIRLEGGAKIWILMYVDTWVFTEPPYGMSARGGSITRRSKLFHIEKFKAIHAVLYASGSGVGTYQAAQGSYDSYRPGPFLTQSYYNAGGLADFSAFLNCPIAFYPYAGKAELLATYNVSHFQMYQTGRIYYSGAGNLLYERTSTYSPYQIRAGRVSYAGSIVDHTLSQGSTTHSESATETTNPTITTSSHSTGEVIESIGPATGGRLPAYTTNSNPEVIEGVITTFDYTPETSGFSVAGQTTWEERYNSPIWNWSKGPVVAYNEDDPQKPIARTRAEVGHYKQGADFIQYAGNSDNGFDCVVYDRNNLNPKSFGHADRAIALSYSHWVGWEGLGTSLGSLCLAYRPDNMSEPEKIIARLDLRDIQEIKDDPIFMNPLNQTFLADYVSSGSGLHKKFDGGSNSARTQFTDTSTGLIGYVTIQIIPDQANTFTRGARWT